MRIRADSVLVSSVLHTIALLSLVRVALWNYFATSDKAVLAQMDAGFRKEAQTAHYLGVACLAIILIGLIVLWTGYIKRSRAAWFVMFVIVWFWAFPLFILPIAVPLIRGESAFTFPELLYNAIFWPGFPRGVVELILVFSLMVIGLVLPTERFLVARKADEPIHIPSRRLVGFSLAGFLLGTVVLFFWLSVGVQYQLPNPELSLIGGSIPPPPPPPNP